MSSPFSLCSKNLPIESLSLKYNGHRLSILDQRQLPHKSVWLDSTSPEQMIQHIQSLAVRGAPMIAISAALCLGHYCASLRPEAATFLSTAQSLIEARPTAVNLSLAIQRLIEAFDESQAEKVLQKAIDLFHEDKALCANIIRHGCSLLTPDDQILTHCNTGGLATAGEGTALGIITHGFRQFSNAGSSINYHVYVDETRPLLQGGRLTTWELQTKGVPYTLICDSMSASLMQAGKVTKVIVGADRITSNGDFANKVGTYALAVLCQYHDIPFYVAAPSTTVDKNTVHGQNIQIEQRGSQEVTGISTFSGSLSWAPHQTSVFNPAFDVTPAYLVTAWILDSGIYDHKDIQEGALNNL